ncbi:TVP38/TMEM64 family protein [Planosporangium sp. 12N6]|uniref:TVP38/TMEM64 family protein n=1 Tax=Planosporangium spinosum TaxID=3402278 RepID=UPI003CE86E81
MPSPFSAGKRPRSSVAAAVRFGALVVLVAGLGLATLLAHPSRHGLLHAAHSSHLVAPLIAVVGSALLVAALTPRTLLSFVGGALFGTLAGSAYVLIGVTAGATLSFCIGRLLGRDFVAGHLRGRFALIERAVARRAMTSVMVSRLIPLVPFGVSNYAFGTTSVRFVPYLAGTVIGAMPATMAYAALGSATMRSDPAGATYAGIAVGALAVAGSIGTFLVWRRRPRSRSTAEPQQLPAAPQVPAAVD